MMQELALTEVENLLWCSLCTDVTMQGNMRWSTPNVLHQQNRTCTGTLSIFPWH